MKNKSLEKSGYSILILGSGKQGIAAAYDVLKFSNPDHLTLADQSIDAVKKAVSHLRKLLPQQSQKIKMTQLIVQDKKNLHQTISGHTALLSALPYYLNPAVASEAVRSRTHYCDLGGYIDSTHEILKLDRVAKRFGITLITDCGIAPGLCNSLAQAGIESLDQTNEVKIYCGGLPQKPRPPLGYRIVFSLEGVIGNYLGKSYVLREKKVKLVSSLSERETIQFPKPLGTLEAAITGGATGTCPWTYRGKIKTYEYKTLRYPGHYDAIVTLRDLGLLDKKEIDVKGKKVSPHDVFITAVTPQLIFPEDRDWLILRVVVKGKKNKKNITLQYDMCENDDPKTGFSSMQRTTGFSAAIVLEHLAQKKVSAVGVVPLERAISGKTILSEVRHHGLVVKEKQFEGK